MGPTKNHGNGNERVDQVTEAPAQNEEGNPQAPAQQMAKALGPQTKQTKYYSSLKQSQFSKNCHHQR